MLNVQADVCPASGVVHVPSRVSVRTMARAIHKRAHAYVQPATKEIAVKNVCFSSFGSCVI